MKNFNVSFVIPGSKLTTIVQVLSNEVSKLKIEQCGGDDIEAGATRTVKKNMTTRGSRLQIALMKFMVPEKVYQRKELEQALSDAGFASSSFSPLRSKMLRQKLLTSPEPGLFVINSNKV